MSCGVAGRSGAILGRVVSALLVTVAALAGTSCTMLPEEGSGAERFATPEEAVDVLVASLRANDMARLESIVGARGGDLIHSGDEVADRAARERFVDLYDERHHIDVSEGRVATLHVGKTDWPFPVPIVQDGDAWSFDAEEGREELLDRRIERNELNTIQVCLACVDAQREYASEDRDGDGLLEYAQKVRSSPGKRDGLYWEVKEGEKPSPLESLMARATREGYEPREDSDEPRPYHGYVYKLLKEQGEHAPGGAHRYVARGSMVGGFALVAHPAAYGRTGIMTFMVSHDGVVYEKDLGDGTRSAVESITAFDPDDTWAPVPPEKALE